MDSPVHWFSVVLLPDHHAFVNIYNKKNEVLLWILSSKDS